MNGPVSSADQADHLVRDDASFGALPGDLPSATNPDSGRRWRFLPDLGAAEPTQPTIPAAD